jgi:hypothetical protein
MAAITPIPDTFLIVSSVFSGERFTYFLKTVDELGEFILEDLTEVASFLPPHPAYAEWVRSLATPEFAACEGNWTGSYFDGKLVMRSKRFTRDGLIDALITLNFKGTAAEYSKLLRDPTVSDRIIHTLVKLNAGVLLA